MSRYPIRVEQAMLDLGRRLALARKARGFSQPDLAATAGVGLSTVVGVEAGHPGASIGNVLKLLNAMQLLDQVEDLADPARDERITEAGIASLSGSPVRRPATARRAARP